MRQLNNQKLNIMKVDYKNYPILEKLEKESLGIIPFFELDRNFVGSDDCKFLTDNWKKNSKEFKKEINVISMPFIEASRKAKEKLSDLIKNIAENNLSDIIIKGSFIVGNSVMMINIQSIKNQDNYFSSFYIFDKDGIPLLMSQVTNEYSKIWTTKSMAPTEIHKELFYQQTIGEIIILSMFKKYAEVETKILRPHQKPREISCLYRNNTKMNLTFLDCKWFTTLVKSDAFKVSGHFRLQPCKIDGEWTKKIIWISDFMKSGYTSHAKILSQ